MRNTDDRLERREAEKDRKTTRRLIDALKASSRKNRRLEQRLEETQAALAKAQAEIAKLRQGQPRAAEDGPNDLITQAEAARLAAVSVQAISQRINAGTLTAYIDPDSQGQRQGRRLVSLAQLMATYAITDDQLAERLYSAP